VAPGHACHNPLEKLGKNFNSRERLPYFKRWGASNDDSWNLADHPNFSPTGSTLRFGFIAGLPYGNYALRSQLYDNWSLKLATAPLPSRVTSVATGNWNDPTTWDNGIPDASRDAKVMDDTVTVSADGSGRSLKIDHIDGKVMVGAGKTLTVVNNVDVAKGTLQILGTLAANSIAIDGGTISMANSSTPVVCGGNIGPGGATVVTQGSARLTLHLDSDSVVHGNLTKQGSGGWVLDGGLALLGDINVQGGTLELGKDLLALGSGPITIGNATLKAAGSVPRPISMQGGADPFVSTIMATGPLTLGDQGSAGYNFAGILDVGAHPVTVLGPPGTPMITTALLNGGTLTGSPELKVAPSVGVIYGTGKVTGTVRLGEAGVEAALVSGIDDSNRLELSGLVRGNAPAGYVDFTGYGPTGFSPGYFFARHVSYATAVFEIRGTAPGQVTYNPATDVDVAVAGEYSQFHVVGDATGTGSATLFTSLALNKSAGFEWTALQPGDLDLIFAAAARLKIGFPLKATDLQAGTIAYGPSFFADLNNQLASINASLAPLGRQMLITQADASGLTLTVVPEPGTLVLLLTGGLGLVLLVRRRSQIRKAATAVS